MRYLAVASSCSLIQRYHSLSLARRHLVEDRVKFDGQQVTSMDQEVDVVEGSAFAVSKGRWQRQEDQWVRIKNKYAGIEDHEGSLRFGERYLVFPKSPAECDYVRIVDCHSLAEIAYWTVTEWEEAGAEVMGAIIGGMCEGIQKG